MLFFLRRQVGFRGFVLQILFTALALGALIIIQGNSILPRFGQDKLLYTLLAIVITGELGLLLTAFFFKRQRINERLAMHSCGSIHELIPELIDNGVDILNPLKLRARNEVLCALVPPLEDLVLKPGSPASRGLPVQSCTPYKHQMEVAPAPLAVQGGVRAVAVSPRANWNQRPRPSGTSLPLVKDTIRFSCRTSCRGRAPRVP